MANYFSGSFFNPYGETEKKPKIYAEILCGAVVTKCHRPIADCGHLMNMFVRVVFRGGG